METSFSRALRWLACVGLLLGGAGSAAAQPAASAWPLFHGDAQRSGRSSYSGPASPSNVRVAFRGFGAFRNSPVIGPDGIVYVATGRQLCAIDPSDNDNVKWCTEINSNAVFASPALGVDPMNPAKIVVYQGQRGNRFLQIDEDGTIRWQYAVGVDGDVATSAAINPSGTVFFGGSGRMHSISPTGVINWVQQLDGTIFMANPVLGTTGTVYVASIRGTLYSFTPGGTQNWSIDCGSNIRFAAPAIGPDGTIYIGTREGLVSVTDNGMSATINWTFEMPGRGVVSTPAIGLDGTIYVGGQGFTTGVGGAFYAVKPDGTGTYWTYQAEEFFRGSPLLDAAGRIYATTGRSVIAFDSTNFANPYLWEFTTGRNLYSSPALDADGTLWVTGADRNLYAISD